MDNAVRPSGIGEGIIGAIEIVITLVLSPFIRPWYNRWGATDEELERALSGDDLVSGPRQRYTRAISINASAADIWPWLVQMGQGRGGLYSYDWLENLIGCDIHSVGRVVPEFQELQIGDAIRLGPEGYPLFRVVAVGPERALVLQAANPTTGEIPHPAAPRGPDYANSSWVFALDERGDGTTRLIIRGLLDHASTFASSLVWGTTEPISFVMMRKQMRGIKQRAESAGGGTDQRRRRLPHSLVV